MKNLTIKILCFVCVVLCVFSTRVWSGDVATAFDLNDELGDPDDTCPGLGQGNPVHVGLGNKFQEIVVYQGIGSNPLTFAWFYNSELLGQQAWRHNVQFMMNTPFVHSAGTAFWHDLDYRAADGSGAYIDVDKPIITSFYSGNNQCPGPVPPPRNWSHVENFSVDRSHKTRVTLVDTGPYCRASRSILSIVYSKPDGVTETFTRQTPNNNPLQGFHAWNKSIAFPNGDKHQYNYRYDGAHYYVDARHSNGQSHEVKYALYFPSSSSPLHRILPESLTVGELVWTFEYRLIQGSGSFAYVLEKITGPGNNTMAFSYQSKPVDLGGYFRHQVMLTDRFVNGQHYAGWVYDNKQRAYRSYHGPNLSSHYASEDTFPDETMTGAIELSDLDHHDIRTSTNEYGQSTHYNFQILEGYEDKKKTKLIGLTGEASTNCLPTHSTIDYDTFWRKEQITDAKGNKTKYEYTAGEGARGHLERVIRAHETAIAQTTVIEYQDEDRKLVDRIIRNGLTINYDYYPNGRLSDITYTDTTQHEVPYPTHGQQRAYHIDYEYDNDNPDKVCKITVDGPRTDVHDVSVYEFDELGRLNKYVDAKGHKTTFSNFNKWLVPETVTDANGQIITLGYDDGFNQPLLSSIQPQGQAALTIAYNDFELPEVVTYPGGVRFTYSYKTGDAASIYQVENQLGQRLLIDQSIDREEQAKHFITQTFDSEASTASFQYRYVLDALGRLYQTFPVDGMTEYHYDRNDNLEVMTRSGKTVVVQISIWRVWDHLMD